jgi:hypothetical protein
MKPLELVYWIRLVTGVIAAFVCIGYVSLTTGSPTLDSLRSTDVVFYSISLAIVVYVLSYYILKARFKDRVAKTQKLFTTGIGVYFLAWIVCFALFYTWLYGPVWVSLLLS